MEIRNIDDEQGYIKYKEEKMKIRTYNYKLEKELKQYTSYLIINFNKEEDAVVAAEELSKQYESIAYITEDGLYYNVFVPATKNGVKLFDYEIAYNLGKEISQKYNGNGFITDFGDKTSFDEDGELVAWMDGGFWGDEEELSRIEILALQLAGVKDNVILNLSRDDFNMLTEELGGIYDESLYKAKRIIKREEDNDINTITFQETDYYPEMLNVLGDERPPIIHYIGNEELLERTDSVAIIGARRADKMGNEAAYNIGIECAKRGKVVISGLALGCDGAAHRGCLDAHGETIAIVANGLDVVHPKEHEALQERIVKNGGLVLSEHPIGVNANPARLVARNRLQAALAEKVVVAQCPAKSGTMYTANFAEKYKKKMYAVAFTKDNEFNSGNKLLLQEQRALPITKLWEL